MKISIANDHAGLNLKNIILNYLNNKNFSIIDLGVNKDKSVDYPDYAYSMAKIFKNESINFGILICGTGIGISIAANRFKHIRAALCHDVDTTKLARQHNNANIIVLGGRIINPDLALRCVETFINTEYEGGRHDKRINKLDNPTIF